MNLKEIGINTSNWIDSAQDRDYWRSFVNVALNLLELISYLASTDKGGKNMYADSRRGHITTKRPRKKVEYYKKNTSRCA